MNMSDLQSIKNDLNQRNFPNLDKKGKILHVAGNDKNSKLTIIMEIKAEIYKHIKEIQRPLRISEASSDIPGECPLFAVEISSADHAATRYRR